MTSACRRGPVPAALALLITLAFGHSPTASADPAVIAGRASAHGVPGASRSAEAPPAKASSFAPRHAHNSHAYGAPIQPPILKRRTQHHKPHPAA